MATIIPLRSHPARTVLHSAPSRRAGGAEIVIFPGIRYERWDDETGSAPQQPKRRRDVLDFED